MLQFRIWNADNSIDGPGRLAVDPAAVVSVVETEMRRACGGNNPVAVLRLHDGKEYVVYDSARQVAVEIGRAKAAAAADAAGWIPNDGPELRT